MSLCAIGMPVSGPASPFARRSSTVRKALSSRSKRAMRSRCSRVSSTEESFFAARAWESSVRVALITLLDDLGHQVQAALDRRRGRLVGLARLILARLVGA